MSKHGRITGYYDGYFGVDDDDNNVFFGKWIDESGRFSGFIRGVWSQHPNHNANINAVRHAGGRFDGEILDASEQPIGTLKGKYKSHPEFKKGFLQGRWKLDCDETEEYRDEGL